MAQPNHHITTAANTTKPVTPAKGKTATPSPTPTKKKSQPSFVDEIIKAGVSQLSDNQKAQIAKLLGIKYDPKVTNPDYKGDPKDINPNWKP